MRTCERKVVIFASASMFQANNMINLKCNESIRLPDFAVFTTVTSPLSDE